jgi:hypothetical protein
MSAPEAGDRHDGNVYVGDPAASGFRSSMGAACSSPSGARAWTAGRRVLGRPADPATDASGNVYVADIAARIRSSPAVPIGHGQSRTARAGRTAARIAPPVPAPVAL